MSHDDFPYQGSYSVDLSSVAALAFLVWDIVITIDQEVDAVWSKPNGFYSKWIFLFVRYFAVAMQISLLFVGTQTALDFHYTESDCVRWYIFQEVGTQLLVTAVESILIMRVHALYDRNRGVTLALIVLFVVENVVMIVTLIDAVPGARFDASCTVIHSPSGLVTFAAAFVSFEAILFALTLFRFLVALRNGWGRTPVVYLLMRDGTWAFILIFITLCVNAGFYLGAGNSPFAAIAFPWLLSIESFAGSRIVLNLHAISFDVPTHAIGTRGDRTLSSQIVFTTHSPATPRPRTPSVSWDWGGPQQCSHDGGPSSTATGTISESYEMTSTASVAGTGHRKHSGKMGSSTVNYLCPNTSSDTCVEVEKAVV